MSYDASPYDDPQFAEEVERDRDREEQLADEEAAIRWDQLLSDERSSAEAHWRDLEAAQ